MMSLAALAALSARPQHGDKAFTPEQISTHLAVLLGWQVSDGKLCKTFSFRDYYDTIAFVNVVAAIAHATDHHPDLSVHFNRCIVGFNTHDVEHGRGGLSINDFICAARIETFVAQSAAPR
jgi:4a-hydroxytetrahydrobiopterin dehydratase